MRIKLTHDDAKALVFDIENRPLSYWYDGRPTAEVTTVSWKWLGNDGVKTELMSGVGNKTLLSKFRPVYESAQIVVGHNIRSHDLPILNAAYLENGFDPLPPILTIDTYGDLLRYKDIPKSLEYLCELLECPFPKFHMTQHSWRQANRLHPDGLRLTRQRCEIDVRASEWCYLELIKRGWLVKPPKRWTP